MLQFRTHKELAAFLHLEVAQLESLLADPPLEDPYTTHYIEKRSGGTRELRIPNKKLKSVQGSLRSYLESRTSPATTPYAHAFHRHRSIVTNALQHSTKALVLTVDIADFFNSITKERVAERLAKRPFHATPEVAQAIAQLACDEGELPQGSPLSPLLANLVCDEMDQDIATLAGADVTYTRYADDLTFSTERDQFPPELMERAGSRPNELAISGGLQEVLRRNGFRINHRKTRLQTRAQRQVVTGLIVNDKPNVRRQHLRKIRSSIHALETYYAGKELSEQEMQRRDSLNVQIAGYLAFLCQVSGPANARVAALTDRWHRANGREIRTPVGAAFWQRRFEYAVMYIEVNGKPANGVVNYDPDLKVWSVADPNHEVVRWVGASPDKLNLMKVGVTISPRRSSPPFDGEQLFAVFAGSSRHISAVAGVALAGALVELPPGVPSGALLIDARGVPVGLYDAQLGTIETHANLHHSALSRPSINASTSEVL